LGNYHVPTSAAIGPLIRVSLNSLEARLDPALLFPASRQHIVNLRFIESVETTPDDSYVIQLKNKTDIPVSRRQSRQLRENLGFVNPP
jgi:two-component system, LytTR family, response regulator